MASSAALFLMLAAAAGGQTIDLSRDSLQPYQAASHGVEPGGNAQGFAYSVALPEGRYRVTLQLGEQARAGDTTCLLYTSPSPRD